MQIEYEATFANINKDKIRGRLKSVGAELVKPEFMQKRRNFNLPKGNEIEGGWLRVRDEGDKITMSLKVVAKNEAIDDQKEICLVVDNFEKAQEFLSAIGCTKKAYQESMREIWMLDGVEICIDEWPYLEPYVEIEGESEEAVKEASEKLGFDYAKAVFGAVDQQYKEKYGISEEIINNVILEITFNGENPFVKFKK
jgi:adenylate cyclase class 2